MPTSADIATRAYRKSRLAIRRNQSAHYTELLESLEAYRDHLERRVEYLRLGDELEAGEAEWHRFLVRRLSGAKQAPTRVYLAFSTCLT